MIASRLLTDRFPEAVGAIVGGSTARGTDTATSDVDVVVVLPGPPAPLRATERHGGRLVEFFVHTGDSLLEFVDRERARRRSPLLHMTAFGTVVADIDGRVARLQDLARALAGKPAQTPSTRASGTTAATG